MTKEYRITTHPFESMDELLLHVKIAVGEDQVYQRVIQANNTDQVVQLFDDAAQAANANVSDMEQELADHVTKARDWWEKKQAEDKAVSGYQGKFLSSTELEQLDVRHRWLVKHILVRDQPAMLGGPKKSMKTSIMLDLAISLGSGRPFLGKFEVPERVKVAVLSGESGQTTIKETALRVARTKGVPLGACDVLWGFDLPRLGVDADLQALSAALRDNEVRVVFIDPAYLCLLAGAQDLQANNMFQVGPLLMRVARVCSEVGATLVLVHHTTKMAGMQKGLTGEPLELEDLAYAGFQEFARQWVLINRREKYEAGSGKHLLWMNIGGSAGHSGCWGIDVEEGKLEENFGGRQWQVQVRNIEDARKVVAEGKERSREGKKKARLDDVKAKLRQVLPSYPDGETCTALAERIGEGTRLVTPALTDMLEAGEVAPCEVIKQAGRRTQSLPAWRLASAVDIVKSRTKRMGLQMPGCQVEEDNVMPAPAVVAHGDSAESPIMPV